MTNQYNVDIRNLPIVVIKAIRDDENIVNVLLLTKGASECLYVIQSHSEETGKEIFRVVSYGKSEIEYFLKNADTSQLDFQKKHAIEKIHLLIETLIEEYSIKETDCLYISKRKASISSIQNIDDFIKLMF